MPFFKKYLLLLLLAVFMLSSVGIAVSKHICYSEGITEFSLTGNSSCGEHQNESAAKSCCKKPMQQSNKKPGCCNEDFVYAVLDIVKKHEERNDHHALFSIVTDFIFSFQNQNAETAYKVFRFTRLPFPPPSGSVNQFLSLLSVFRL